MPGKLRWPTLTLLSVAAILAMLAALHTASAASPLNVSLYPPAPAPGEPVLLLVKPALPGAVLRVNVSIDVSVEASLRSFPPCTGSWYVNFEALYPDGRPAGGAMVVVRDRLHGGYCRLRLRADGTVLGHLDPGDYDVYVFADRDGDSLYEYAGYWRLEFWCTCTIPYVQVVLEPLAKLLELPQGLNYSFEVGGANFFGYTVFALPPLPSATASSERLAETLQAWGVSEVLVSLISRADYTVYASGEPVYTGSYTVNSSATNSTGGGLVVAAMASTPPSELLPWAAAIPSCAPVNITVVGFERCATLNATLELEGQGQRSIVELHELPAMELLRGTLDEYTVLAERVRGLLESLKGAAGVELDYKVKPLGLLAVYAVVEPGGPGSLLTARVTVHSSLGGSVSLQLGPYYVYNSSSNTTVLVVDPTPLLQALRGSLEAVAAACQHGVDAPGPLAELAAKLYCSLSPRLLKAAQLAPTSLHHWEVLGRSYRLALVTDLSDLARALDREEPRVVVLSSLWLAVDNGEPLFPGATSGLASLLLDYARGSHAGIVATYTTLPPLPTRDSGWLQLAHLLGLGLLKPYTRLASRLGAGDIPLLLGWVEWSHKLSPTGRAAQLGIGLPRQLTVDPGVPTLVGWQLAVPGAPLDWLEAIETKVPSLATVYAEAVEAAGLAAGWQPSLELDRYPKLASELAGAEAADSTLRVGAAEAELPVELLEELAAYQPLNLIAVSSDGLAGIIAYDRWWDPHGYRAVYISFEAESSAATAATVLAEATRWAANWTYRPAESPLEMLREAVKARGLLAYYGATLATPKGAEVKLIVPSPATLEIAVMPAERVKVELEPAKPRAKLEHGNILVVEAYMGTAGQLTIKVTGHNTVQPVVIAVWATIEKVNPHLSLLLAPVPGAITQPRMGLWIA